MKKRNFKMTDYLVVEVSDHVKEKYIGFKCIPARWAENRFRHPTAGRNDIIIRYPEEESSETALQVKNKEPFNPTWPTYSALIKFVNGSYENACKLLNFLKEQDEMDLPTTADEPPMNTLNNAELNETPSTSFKRRLSDENEKIAMNEDILTKKKRVSAIRSENNTKFLIQSGQLLSNKQKVSPKKLLSLRKEVRTETLDTLISTEKFNKLDKLFSKYITEEPHETLEIISSTDDSDTDGDNDGEPETLRPPEKSMLETVLTMTNPTITTKQQNPALQSSKTPEISKTPLRETVGTGISRISSTKHLEQHKALNAEISTLRDPIRNLAPTNSGNGTKNDSAEDIKHLEDIYKSILSTKSNLNAVYVEKGEGLRKCFNFFNLVVPELKQGLSLPSIQQLRENRLVTNQLNETNNHSGTSSTLST